MTILKGTRVRIIGTNDVGTIALVSRTSQTCAIQLDSGPPLKKNVPLDEVEEYFGEVQQVTNAVQSPIRLSGLSSPTKIDNSQRLQQGSVVKARYQKGNEWLSGTVTKVRFDGSVDIVYDNGKEEMQVKSQYVECVNSTETQEKITTKDDSLKKERNMFANGERVQAAHNKGKRMYPGKVSCVHSNGTYDIEYDDGDKESCVDPKYIEPLASKDNVAVCSLQKGDVIKAYYKKGKDLYSGRIADVHPDGTFDIEYDDGDFEGHVHFHYIQQNPCSPNASKTSPLRSLRSSRNSPSRDCQFKVGDYVQAPYKSGKSIRVGKISKINTDNSYNVVFENGWEEISIQQSVIEASKGALVRQTDLDHCDVTAETVFAKGDVVQARYRNKQQWYKGKISKVRSDGTYDITYDDGDTDTGLPSNAIKPDGDRKQSSVKKRKSLQDTEQDLKVGDVVKARYNSGKKYFSGKIAKVQKDGTYDIIYDDGDEETCVQRADINYEGRDRLTVNSQDNMTTPKKMFQVEECVIVILNKGGRRKKIPGRVKKVRSDGTYDIETEDGSIERRVHAKYIQADISPIIKTPDNVYHNVDGESTNREADGDSKQLKVGEQVKAFYKNGKKLYNGEITRVHSDGTADILYDDGDVEKGVNPSNVITNGRVFDDAKVSANDEQNSNNQMLSTGDKVKALYKNGRTYYPGKITKVYIELDAYDIIYNDGDFEERVSRNKIQLISREEKSSGSSDEKKRSSYFAVGDKVKAQDHIAGPYYNGVIRRVHRDGTLDIHFDDGEDESKINPELVVGLGTHKFIKKNFVRGTSSEVQSDKNTSSHSSEGENDVIKLEKGMIVSLRKALAHLGKGRIAKVHSNGTYDIKLNDENIIKKVMRDQILVHKLGLRQTKYESSDEYSNASNKCKKKISKFQKNQRVKARWHRLSSNRKSAAAKWDYAMILACHSNGTYTIRYEDSGVVEDDAPEEAIKFLRPREEKIYKSMDNDSSFTREQLKGEKVYESDFILLEELAMTVHEEGSMKAKPKLHLLRHHEELQSTDEDSSCHSSSSSEESVDKRDQSEKNMRIRKKRKFCRINDYTLSKLFDHKTLTRYRDVFNIIDVKQKRTVSESKMVKIVESLCASEIKSIQLSNYNDIGKPSVSPLNDKSSSPLQVNLSIKSLMREWLHNNGKGNQTHLSRYSFFTTILAFAYTVDRLMKFRIEQSTAHALQGRFASHYESQRVLELWQKKLGFRAFESLQRLFCDVAIVGIFPLRIRVDSISYIFKEFCHHSIPNKPLDIYLQQLHLYPHHTLTLSELLCCYYNLYGCSEPAIAGSAVVAGNISMSAASMELRSIAFIASCLFSSGDPSCQSHSDLVRRLCVGRTPTQQDLVLRFREAFETLQTISTYKDHEVINGAPTVSSSALHLFASKVTSNPSLLEGAILSLRKRSATVSLVEIFAVCGHIIDDISAEPTVANAVAKMRLRNSNVTQVRNIIELIRNLALKVLRYPNNSDYWRLRSDTAAFQTKLGQYVGATNLLEAAGFIEWNQTHYEIRGARTLDGKRVGALPQASLEKLRETCTLLESELSNFDGVEGICPILKRISLKLQHVGKYLSFDEAYEVLSHCSKYIENILRNPRDSRCWRIREQNAIFQKYVGYLPDYTDLMAAIGFDLISTSQGNVFMLRGTSGSLTVIDAKSKNIQSPQVQNIVSLSNFTFPQVSEHTEWFLWRKKHEITNLLEGEESLYLKELLEHNKGGSNNNLKICEPLTDHICASVSSKILKVYPYGRNVVDIFCKSSIQQLQLLQMKSVFKFIDKDDKGNMTSNDLREFLAKCNIPGIALHEFQWLDIESYDIDRNKIVDSSDFIAALGPSLDHTFEYKTQTKPQLRHNNNIIAQNGPLNTSTAISNDGFSLCELVSCGIGKLRLSTSHIEAFRQLVWLIQLIHRIIREPRNGEVWRIKKTCSEGKCTFFQAGIHELLILIGYRQVGLDNKSSAIGSSTATNTMIEYILCPQKMQFKTGPIESKVDIIPHSLDISTIERLCIILSVTEAHHRVLCFPTISDVGAISRAISILPNKLNWVNILNLLLRVIDNILTHPSENRYRQIITTTNTFKNIVSDTQGGLELFLYVGFREAGNSLLVYPFDSDLDECKARKVELQVGLEQLEGPNLQHTKYKAANISSS